MTNKKITKNITNAVIYITAIIVSLIFSLPFLYMVVTSFQNDNSNIFEIPPKILPETWRAQNYIDAFSQMNFLRAIKNTLIMEAGVLVLSLSSSVLVGYGFARFEAKGKNVMFTILLSTMMLPWVVTMVPSFVMFKYFGWIGTRLPLIIPAIGGGAFNIFLVRQFIMGLPRDLDNAAKIDGCNSFGVLVRVLIPNLKPVLATLFMFQFTGTWGDYLGPSIYLLDSDLHTLSLALQSFKDPMGFIDWKLTLAGCVMFSIPMVVVLISLQKYYVNGMVLSSFK